MHELCIFGSSVASGAGASRGCGWADLLASEMAPRGWNIGNRSIGGNASSDLLARYRRDIQEMRPDKVIISISLANEGVNGPNPERVAGIFMHNISELIACCRSDGIEPIIGSCYPNGGYDAERYRLLVQTNRQLHSCDCLCIDFLSPTDDGHGHWKPGCFVDAGHPNDQGHAQMYSAVARHVHELAASTSP